ncbi:MAG: hypothetical protein N2747_00285 [Chitinophagaceae bacterium]|nr:hypothetical protein [Chitinophagaceae bacterium]
MRLMILNPTLVALIRLMDLILTEEPANVQDRLWRCNLFDLSLRLKQKAIIPKRTYTMQLKESEALTLHLLWLHCLQHKSIIPADFYILNQLNALNMKVCQKIGL